MALKSLGRKDLDIIEVGCGSGWFCSQLTRFGRVTGTDLSDSGLARARQRAPEAAFVSGDFRWNWSSAPIPLTWS